MSKKQRKRRSRSRRRVKSRRPVEGLLDGLAHCGEHGFPMVRIGPDYVCVAEYLDQIIGLQKVTGVSRDADGVIYLQFGPQRRLPLFCPCCGAATVTANLRGFERRWRGRRVESFITYQEHDEGRTWDVVGIIFSGWEPEEHRILAIGLKSVRRLEMTG